MKGKAIWTAVVIGAALIVLMAGSFFAQQTPIAPVKDEVALRAAMEKETVQGDLKGAIEAYKKLVQSKDRTIGAKALVRMAECYQKLGDAEARKLYERVIREFAEQKEPVALARARLGGSDSASSAKGDRVVWTSQINMMNASVSQDGRFIVYVGGGARLMIHDIAVNEDRALTPPPNKGSSIPGMPVFSRDGKQIVYRWGDEVRIAALEASGYLKPRVLIADTFVPYDWSPDGKWILATAGRPDKHIVELGLISAADGSLRILKTYPVSATPFKMTRRFSPDGKYIAYDRPAGDTSPSSGSPQLRDVYVVSTDGSRDIPAVVHSANDILMGWSPDGGRLLFSSDRTGSVSLWGLPFADGRVQGLPELLKPNIGPSYSLSVTDSGTLYAYRSVNSRDVVIAPIDLDAGKFLGPPVSFQQGYLEGSHNPMWSRDGKYLAYPVPCILEKGCMTVRSVATGQVRRLAPTLSLANVADWSPDGRSILARGRDVSWNWWGIFQIDVESGEAKPLIVGDASLGTDAQWSPDGRKIYFSRKGVVIERDLASKTEREVYTEPVSYLSRDGKYFVSKRTDPSTKTASLLLIPVAGGQPRELLRLTPPEVFAPSNDVWTPDSSGIIITKGIGPRRELWLVPITGGQPRKLDIDPDIWLEGNSGGGDLGFSLSPDGRHIAFQMGKSTSEVWALENFLPKVSTKH